MFRSVEIFIFDLNELEFCFEKCFKMTKSRDSFENVVICFAFWNQVVLYSKVIEIKEICVLFIVLIEFKLNNLLNWTIKSLLIKPSKLNSSSILDCPSL